MDKSKIERINILAKKSRAEGLTDAEKAEQAALRREYIDAVKTNMRAMLDDSVVVNDDEKKWH